MFNHPLPLLDSPISYRRMRAPKYCLPRTNGLRLPTTCFKMVHPFLMKLPFVEQGKVMDGWESRRRREAGHDWCIIKLSHRAEICGIEVDTAHFTGNNAPQISIEIADLNTQKESRMVSGIPGVVERILHGGDQGVGHTPEEVQEAEESCRRVAWTELLPVSPLCPGYEETRMHYFQVPTTNGTHIRVNYFPDGGVARLRLWGNGIQSATKIVRGPYMPIETGKICTVVHHKDSAHPPSQREYKYPELSSSEIGGIGVDCSNKHYGHPQNLIQPNLGMDMGDGWETARHPNRPAILTRDPTTNLVDSQSHGLGRPQVGQGCSSRYCSHYPRYQTLSWKLSGKCQCRRMLHREW